MQLNRLKNKFPLHSNRLTISVLGKRDLDWYANEIKKDYFIEFNDNKKILNMSLAETKFKILSLIATYSLPYSFIYEFRLIIKNKDTKENIGGITLFPIDILDNSLEIAYWINPKYQGFGFATEAVNRIVQFIFTCFKEIDNIKLIIQKGNIKSIRLATRCGFTYKQILNGAYGVNVEYILKR